MVNSGEYDGMQADTCKSKIITELEAKDVGKRAVNYKLRDWIFSSMWQILGEPIPLVWVSLNKYEKARGNRWSLDLIPENAVTTDKGDQILTPCPCPPPTNFLSNFPKLKIINPQEPVKIAAISEWLDIWFDFGDGNPLPRPEPKPDGENWVSTARDQYHAPMGRVLLVPALY